MTALDRALALAQVDAVAVPRRRGSGSRRDAAARSASPGRPGRCRRRVRPLPGSARARRRSSSRVAAQAHPLAAPAEGRLDQDRVAELLRRRGRRAPHPPGAPRIPGRGARRLRRAASARRPCPPWRGSPRAGDRRRRCPRLAAGLREVRVLREKPVAGVDVAWRASVGPPRESAGCSGSSPPRGRGRSGSASSAEPHVEGARGRPRSRRRSRVPSLVAGRAQDPQAISPRFAIKHAVGRPEDPASAPPISERDVAMLLPRVGLPLVVEHAEAPRSGAGASPSAR